MIKRWIHQNSVKDLKKILQSNIQCVQTPVHLSLNSYHSNSYSHTWSKQKTGRYKTYKNNRERKICDVKIYMKYMKQGYKLYSICYNQCKWITATFFQITLNWKKGRKMINIIKRECQFSWIMKICLYHINVEELSESKPTVERLPRSVPPPPQMRKECVCL